MTIDKLEIVLGESVDSERLMGRPDDPLNELTPFELGLRRFLYDRNRHVSVRAGASKLDVLLFPDVSLLVPWLPAKLNALAAGETTCLEFPESCFEVELSPRATHIACSIHRFGDCTGSKHYVLDARHTVDAVRGFLLTVLDQGVTAGYIAATDVSRFL
jgi:hypothetical protein